MTGPTPTTLAEALARLDMATAEPDVPALTGFDVFRPAPKPGNGRTEAQQAVYGASSVQRLLAARATAAAMRAPLQGALSPSAAEALARSARSVGTAVLAAVWKRYADCRVPYRPDPTADAEDMAERRERIHGPLRAWCQDGTPAETCGEWLHRQPDWVRHEEIAALAAA